MELSEFQTIVMPWLGVFVLYVFGAPLLNLFTFRQKALPNIVPYDFDVPLPDDVRAYLSDCHDQMESLGFENTGTFSLPNQMKNVKAVFVLYSNHHAKSSAASVVILPQVLGSRQQQTMYTAFSTRFSDGCAVNTMNMRELNALPDAEFTIRTHHPRIRNIRDLYAAHEAIREHSFPGGERVQSLYDRFDGNAAECIGFGIVVELNEARKQGYLRLVGGDSQKFDDAMSGNPYRVATAFVPLEFRATIKGAYLMTWKQLWPFKLLVNQLRLARDRRRLNATGYSQ